MHTRKIRKDKMDAATQTLVRAHDFEFNFSHTNNTFHSSTPTFYCYLSFRAPIYYHFIDRAMELRLENPVLIATNTRS